MVLIVTVVNDNQFVLVEYNIVKFTHVHDVSTKCQYAGYPVIGIVEVILYSLSCKKSLFITL